MLSNDLIILMRIANGEDFLSIESRFQGIELVVWRVEAYAICDNNRFSAVHDAVPHKRSPEATSQLDDFCSLGRDRFDLALSGEGWLRTQRDSSGRLIVRYRIVSVIPIAAMEGMLFVEAESASSYCRELKALLSC